MGYIQTINATSILLSRLPRFDLILTSWIQRIKSYFTLYR